jgi:hypothetical protein
MNIAQIYETTISDNDTNVAFSCVVLPARSLPEEPEVTEPIGEGLEMKMEIGRDDYVRRQLGMEHFIRIEAGKLETALTVALGGFRGRWHPFLFDQEEFEYLLKDDSSGRFKEFAAQHRALAQYILNDASLPFEQSPLQGISLGALGKASPYALGAYIGYAAGGGTPLILITVPAGIIVCGAAAGVGKALEEGLREKIKLLLAKKGRKARRKEGAKPGSAAQAEKPAKPEKKQSSEQESENA